MVYMLPVCFCGNINIQMQITKHNKTFVKQSIHFRDIFIFGSNIFHHISIPIYTALYTASVYRIKFIVF